MRSDQLYVPPCFCAPTFASRAKCTVWALLGDRGLCYVLRLRRGGCVTCYGFGQWSVLRVTAFGGSCVTQCYVLQLFGSVTLNGVDTPARTCLTLLFGWEAVSQADMAELEK